MFEKFGESQGAMILGSRRGFTLVEGLMAVIISAIALMTLAVPFLAQQRLWRQGWTQSEAQRDAQIVMRSIARSARQASAVAVSTVSGYERVDLTVPSGSGNCTVTFEGGAALNGGQLRKIDGCDSNTQTLLIDGVRSRVGTFSPTRLGNGTLLSVDIDVITEDQENEPLSTTVFLRNR